METTYKYKWPALALILIALLGATASILWATSDDGPNLTLSAGGGSVASSTYTLGLTLGQAQPVGVSSSPSYTFAAGFSQAPAAPSPSALPGDLNGDGRVDSEDPRIVLVALGTAPPSDPRADVNGDNEVGLLDLAFVARYFGSVAAP